MCTHQCFENKINQTMPKVTPNKSIYTKVRFLAAILMSCFVQCSKREIAQFMGNVSLLCGLSLIIGEEQFRCEVYLIEAIEE